MVVDKDGGWKMVCERWLTKIVCERGWLTKMVKDGGGQRWLTKMVKDGV